MTAIPLSRGMVALIDDADVPLVQGYKWHAIRSRPKNSWYAKSWISGKVVSMHKLLLPGHKEIDHKNGNGLDNQRHNIRPATHAQNSQNRIKSYGSSRFKGVHWNEKRRRWIAQINRNKWLGTFKTEEDAARAYNTAATNLFGEFARLNVVS